MECSCPCSSVITGVLIIPPPLRIFELQNFPKVFIIYKKSRNFFLRFLLFTKKIACGGLLLFTKFRKLKFGPSGGRFFNKNAVFALKYPKKFSACGGLMRPCFYYSQKKFACGGHLLLTKFQNRFAFIIHTKSSKVFFWHLLFTH